MKTLAVTLAATMAVLAGSASAQLVDKKGISLAEAKKILAAAEAEATKNKFSMACAVLDDGATLVAFSRLDGTQIASTEIAIRKAKSAVMFKRPTKAFEERMAGGAAGSNLPTLHPSVTASAGGVPILYHDQLIGAVGCSGGTSAQDDQVASAGVAAASK